MIQVPNKFADAHSLKDRVMYVLSVLQKGSADEIAMEIMELQGIASEEGVAELTLEVEGILETLLQEEQVSIIKEHRQKNRFVLNQSISS